MLSKLCQNMIQYYAGDPKRIQHFIKVHAFGRLICEMEKVDRTIQSIVEIAGYTHDIGIKEAEQKYGYCTGKLQEKEGVAAAQKMLLPFKLEQNIIDEVCHIISHHHTYEDIDTLSYQILVEADLIVNCYEKKYPPEKLQSTYEIFKTPSGKKLFQTIFFQQ